MDALERQHMIRHPVDWLRMRVRHWLRTRHWGKRVRDGGEWGTIVPCPTCDGTGTLHRLDNPPAPTPPPRAFVGERPCGDPDCACA